MLILFSCQENNKQVSIDGNKQNDNKMIVKTQAAASLYDRSAEEIKYKEYIDKSEYDRLSKDGLLKQPGMYYVLDGPLNVRLEPHLGGKILGRINLHEQVQTISQPLYLEKIDGIWAGWCPVIYKSGLAYIWAGYLADKYLVCDIDGNGVKDFFYCRFRDVQSYQGFMHAEDDIFIYINNKKINTKDDFPIWVTLRNCTFHLLDNKVKIELRSHSNTDYVYDVTIDNNGEVKITRDISFDRQDKFISEYKKSGIRPPRNDSFSELIKRIGEPVKKQMVETNKDGETQILEYKDWKIEIFVYGNADPNWAGTYYPVKVNSTDNGVYEFGIKHGMSRSELVEIFGEKAMTGNTISFDRYIDYDRETVEIFLENDIIKSISWTFSWN